MAAARRLPQEQAALASCVLAVRALGSPVPPPQERRSLPRSPRRLLLRAAGKMSPARAVAAGSPASFLGTCTDWETVL